MKKANNLIAKDVTILVPTRNRPNFLYRLLNYYSQASFKGCIFIGDASDDEALKDNKKIISGFNPKIDIKHFALNLDVNSTLEFLSKKIQTTYCLYCADDDFIAPIGIEKSIIFLKENSDYNAVHGKGAMFTIDSDGCFGNINTLFSYPQTKTDGETAVERLSDYLTPSCALLFSLHKTSSWQQMFKGMSSYDWATKQQILITIDELLPSGVSAILGKIKEIDGLYLIRQSHSEVSWSSNRSPYDLILYKDWSIAIKDTSERFIEQIMIKDQIGYDEAQASVYESFLIHWKYIFVNYEYHKVQKKLIWSSFKNFVKIKVPSTLYLKNFITSILISENEKNIPISLRTLEDQSSIYYNDMKLIQKVCSERYEENE